MGLAEWNNANFFPGCRSVFETPIPDWGGKTFQQAVKAIEDSESGYSATVKGGRCFSSATPAELETLLYVE